MELMTNKSKDSLLAAKISQAHHANNQQGLEPTFQVGDRVLLATGHQQREYMQAKSGHVAKFMPRFDGLYEIMHAFPETSDYRLALPTTEGMNTFHVSHL